MSFLWPQSRPPRFLGSRDQSALQISHGSSQALAGVELPLGAPQCMWEGPRSVNCSRAHGKGCSRSHCRLSPTVPSTSLSARCRVGTPKPMLFTILLWRKDGSYLVFLHLVCDTPSDSPDFSVASQCLRFFK